MIEERMKQTFRQLSLSDAFSAVTFFTILQLHFVTNLYILIIQHISRVIRRGISDGNKKYGKDEEHRNTF